MSGAVLLGTGRSPSPTAPPLMATITAKVGSAWFALVDGAGSANTVYTSADRVPRVGDRIAVQKVGNTLVEIAVTKQAYTPGVWIEQNPGLNVPNVNKTVDFARYMVMGNTLFYRAAITLTTGVVAGSVLIDMPAGLDFAAGQILTNADYLIVGRVRALRAGTSWYAGDIVPFTAKVGGTPARLTVYNAGAPSNTTTSTGSRWAAAIPNAGNFQVGDRWGFEYAVEIV